MAAPTLARQSSDKPLRPKQKNWPFPLNLYQTAVGKKWVMALTGLMLLGFVLFHMVGNLKMYLGMVDHNGHQDYDINIYGEYLRELLVPLLPRTYTLWILRLGLIAAFALHIHSAFSLNKMNLQSNVAYASKRDWISANFASRSMRYTGPIIGLYLLFHLADLTWGVGPASSDYSRGDVYQNVVHSLSRPGIAIIYIVCNIVLCVHIFHGIWSMFQSLGINNPQYNSLRRGAAAAFSLLILIGNLSFPIAVLSGVVDL